MWLFLSDAFLSIVAPNAKDTPNPRSRERLLVVRARKAGDIERVFPKARVHRWPGRDYAFRAFIPRQVVANAIASRIKNMTATNFKSSLREADRHDAYLDVWSTMFGFQKGRYDRKPLPRRTYEGRMLPRQQGKSFKSEDQELFDWFYSSDLVEPFVDDELP